MLPRPANFAPPTPTPTTEKQSVANIEGFQDDHRRLVRPLTLTTPPSPPPPPPPPLPPPPPSNLLDSSLSEYARSDGSASPLNAPRINQSGSAASQSDITDLASSSPGPLTNVRYHGSAHGFGAVDARSRLRPRPNRFPRVSARDKDSDTSDDIFETYNQQFPPLLPTVSSRTALLRERRLITHAITNKVVQTETQVNNNGHPQIPDPYRVPVAGSSASSAVSSSLRQDKDQNDDEVENEEIQKLWVEMKEKRKTVARAKIIMAQHRKRMQYVRRKKNDAEVAFMDHVRRIYPREPGASQPEQQVEQRFGEMQRLSTDYQHMELEYEDLENAMDDEEAILNSFEVRFFSVIAKQHLRASSPSPASEEGSLPKQPEYLRNTPYALRGISLHGPTQDEHPFWKDLVSAIGDMNLALEDLSDLNMRHEALQYAIQMQPIMGKKISEEDANFLSDFPLLESSQKQKMEREMHRVHELHNRCKRHGVDKNFPSYSIAYALDPSIGADLSLDEQWSGSGSLGHERFSKLLSSPDHILRSPHPLTALGELRLTTRWPPNHPEKGKRHASALKEYGIHQLVYDVGSPSRDENAPQNADDPEFVSRWLLYQLRTSPLEVHRLASIFQQTTGLAIRNYERWQDDVLRYWWHDGTLGVPRRQRKHGVLMEGNNEEPRVLRSHHGDISRSNRSRAWSGSSSRRIIRSRSSYDVSSPEPPHLEKTPD